jgi:4-amino-4-deoxy-L-arabinose transferase-like glycosyltransferase
LTPIVILEIGLSTYGQRVARTAMLLTAFFPQMIFWSTALYKDPAVMLCIALNILAVFRLRRRLGFYWIAVYVLTSFGLVWLRFYIFYATAAAAAVGIFTRHRRGVMLGLASQLAIVAAMIVLLLYTPLGQEVRLQSRFLDLQVLSNSRIDLARAGSGFGSEADVSTFGGVLSILPLGVVYLLFAPFPWTVSNLRQALALPDVLIWYALVPALIRGIISARKRLRETMPILVFTTALTLAYGAFLGNVGTAYRQRTQIMMFYFLFIADGIHSRRRPTRDEDAQP